MINKLLFEVQTLCLIKLFEFLIETIQIVIN